MNKKLQNNIPELRFAEFSEEWEEKKLGDIAEIKSGGTPKRGKVEYWNGDIPWVTTSLLNSDEIWTTEEFITKEGLDNSSAKLFPINTILMAMYGQGKTRGMVSNLKIEASTNQACAALILNNSVDNEFVFQSLKNEYETLRKISNDGGQKNLSSGLIRNFKFVIPNSLTEQTKIATFLTAVDKRINLLQKKKAELEQYKKGVMQKIFAFGEKSITNDSITNYELDETRNSSFVIRNYIRFKKEDGSDFEDWEVKKLGEVATFRRGSFPQPYGLSKWYDANNGTPFVQVYDVDNNFRLKNKTKQKISELAKPKSVFVRKGSIVLTIQGSIGRIAITQYDAYVDRTLLIFKSFTVPIDKLYFTYVVYLLFQFEKQRAVGGTIKTITKEKLSKFRINLPCLKEQQKIAKFLSSIDESITNCELRIMNMKEWKKGLLQKMFV